MDNFQDRATIKWRLECRPRENTSLVGTLCSTPEYFQTVVLLDYYMLLHLGGFLKEKISGKQTFSGLALLSYKNAHCQCDIVSPRQV